MKYEEMFMGRPVGFMLVSLKVVFVCLICIRFGVIEDIVLLLFYKVLVILIAQVVPVLRDAIPQKHRVPLVKHHVELLSQTKQVARH